MPDVSITEPTCFQVEEGQTPPVSAWPHIRAYSAADYPIRLRPPSSSRPLRYISRTANVSLSEVPQGLAATQWLNVRAAHVRMHSTARAVAVGQLGTRVDYGQRMSRIFQRNPAFEWMSALNSYLFDSSPPRSAGPNVVLPLSPANTNTLWGFAEGLQSISPRRGSNQHRLPYNISCPEGQSAFSDSHLARMYPALRARMVARDITDYILPATADSSHQQRLRNLVAGYWGQTTSLFNPRTHNDSILKPVLVSCQPNSGGFVILHTDNYVVPSVEGRSEWTPEWIVNYAHELISFNPRNYQQCAFPWNAAAPAIAWINPEDAPPANVDLP